MQNVYNNFVKYTLNNLTMCVNGTENGKLNFAAQIPKLTQHTW